MLKRTLKNILIKLHLFKIAILIYDVIVLNRNYYIQKRKLKKSIKTSKVIFFFPFYHTGGAEFVHLQIVKAITSRSIILFTETSANSHYFKDFQKLATCFELRPFLREIRYYKKLQRVIVRNINRKEGIKIFGCHSRFFYDILPQLNNHVIKIDLIHAFTHKKEFGFEKYSIPFINLLKTRIVISEKVKDDLIAQYKEENIPNSYNKKIKVINNFAEISCKVNPQKGSNKFNILYVGRNSPEKRINVIGKIATQLKKISSKFNIILIGEDLINGVNAEDRASCIFTGHITDTHELQTLYEQAHCVLITSTREGFPISFIEGMSCGAIPIGTNVGGIPYAIKNGENGILINNSSDIISEFVETINELSEHHNNIDRLSKNAYNFALNHFNKATFVKTYQQLLDE